MLCFKYLYPYLCRVVVGLSLILLAITCLAQPESTDTPPSSNVGLVIATDYATGFLSVFSLDERKVYSNVVKTHRDAVVRHSKSKVIIINRLGQDNITLLDMNDGYKVIFESSVGRGANPHDALLLSNNKTAVSLYGRDYLLILDTNTSEEVSRISLQDWIDEDGLPEADSLFQKDGFLYATLQKFNRKDNWKAASNSYLLKISLNNFQVERSFSLPNGNPSSLRYLPEENSLLMSLHGNYSSHTDSSLIKFNLSTENITTVLEGSEVEFSILNTLWVSDELIFVIGSRPSYENNLVAINPKTKNILKTLEPFALGNFYPDMVLDKNKNVYLTDRKTDRSGIRIFDSGTLKEITDFPIDVGLPPESIAIVD